MAYTLGPDDERYLRDAIALAVRNVLDSGRPFGALIVDGDTVVSTGTNRVSRELDVTAHAEIVAIRAACRARHDFSLRGCVLYSSCQPCPMCQGAAYTAGIARVVYAAERDHAVEAGFDDAMMQAEICDPQQLPTMPVLYAPTESAEVPFTLWAGRDESS